MIKYSNAVRLPFLFALKAEINTGHAAPIPIPKLIGKAAANVNEPVIDSACKIPIAALALCKTAVNKIPTRIPMIGFENIVSILMNVSFVLKGETAPLICCIPVIKIANPSMIFPTFLCVVRFPNVFKQIPINANNVVIVAVENKLAIPLDPPT